MAKEPGSEKRTWVDWLTRYEDHFRKALGAKRDFDSWWAQAKTWMMQTQTSLNYGRVAPADIVAAYTAAALNGLLIDGEECMVMIRGKKDPKIKCEVGAKGVVRKAGQAGWIINARTVKAGDKIDLDEGNGHVSHTPAQLCGAKPGETIGYYAVASRRGGASVVRFLSLEDAQKRSTGTGAWKNWGDAMGEKSAVLTLRKVLYFGDEIEDLMASSGATVGDTWAAGIEEEEAAEEPAHPPQPTKDRIQAQAARDAQDAAAEASQAETDEAFVNGDDEGPSDPEPPPPVDGDLPI